MHYAALLLTASIHFTKVATLNVITALDSHSLSSGCKKWMRSHRGLMSLPVLSRDAARSLGALVDGPKMLDYLNKQNLGREDTGRLFMSNGLRSNLESFISTMIGSNASVAHDVFELMQNKYHEHTLGPFVNYHAGGQQYKREHAKSWPLLQETFQEHLYDKVLAALQVYLAPHPVRFHPQLNVSGWPFRIHDYELLSDSPYMQGLLYVGAPPHRDALWKSLDFNFCKCKPDMTGLYSHHTISYTLPLVLPEARGGLRVWKEPKTELHVSEWLADFANCHPRCSDTLWDFHEYAEGVLAVHSGQEFHAIGDDHIFETKPTDRRITMQGHGVFCDGAWYVF